MNDAVNIVMPCYNESETIVSLIEKTGYALAKKRIPHFFTVINDGSKDNFETIVWGINNIEVLHNKKRSGYGFSLNRGFEYSLSHNYKYVVTYDADGQYDIDQLVGMVTFGMSTSSEVVFGNRFLEPDTNFSFTRKFAIQFLNRRFAVKNNGILLDTQCGLRFYRTSSLRKISLKETGYAISIEIVSNILKENITYTQLPVFCRYNETQYIKPIIQFFQLVAYLNKQ